MKKIFFVILLVTLILNACAPELTAIPVPPTATKTPRSAATQTPSPTPETWVSGMEANIGIELPTALFDAIKEQNPVLSADGSQILNAETSEVLLEKRDGVWQDIAQGVVEKNYEWVTASEDFKDSYIPWEEVFDGSLSDWAEREVLPNVEYENHGDKVEHRSTQRSGEPILYFVGYPGNSIKSAAYLYTTYEGREYKIMVGGLEGEGEEKKAFVRVSEYYGNDRNRFDEYWNEMRITPFFLGSIDGWGDNHPFVAESHKLLSENLTPADLEKYIGETAAQWEGIDAPIFSMFSLLDYLTPEQLAEFEPGEGGPLLAIYMYTKGVPRFICFPGVIFYTEGARSELFD